MATAIQKGELAFIPSRSLLIQIKEDDKSGYVSNFRNTEHPQTVLVLGRDPTYCKVLYKGSPWLARHQDLYPV